MNIVITGASKGIGKAIAAAFAAEEAELFLCARNELTLYNTVAELQARNPSSLVKAKRFDISVKEEARAFGNWVLAGLGDTASGRVDVLVNNAGIFTPGSIYNEEDGLLEKMMEINLYGAYHLTRTLAPAMIEARQGLIVNICSIASLHAYKNGGSYSITKYALRGFDKNLREFKIGDEKLAKDISENYLQMLPTRSLLFPHTIEILDYLTQKDYQLHMITNGFEKIQWIKLKNSGLGNYFRNVVTSEACNSLKPKKEIFDFAMQQAGSSSADSIMLGDNLDADIQGAINAGMDTVFVNHINTTTELQPTYTITHLKELENIF